MTSITKRPGRRASVHDLHSFLTRHGVEVLDVTNGVSPETRRLFVGRQSTPQLTHAIAVANSERSAPAIDRESRHLAELQRRLRRPMQGTVPQFVERIDAGGLPGLAVTAVPGLYPSSGRPLRPAAERERRAVHVQAEAVLSWLEILWQDTTGTTAAVDLGRDAADDLGTRYAGAAGVADILGAVHRARSRLGRFTIPRTMSHGCLCTRHVFVADGLVSGVDDWGGSLVEADPLRDLGGWLVRAVGPRLCDVLAARSPHHRALRDFVIGGLAVWGIPSSCWRDVVLLSRAEIAVEGLRSGDYGAMDLLSKVSRALPRERGLHGRGT